MKQSRQESSGLAFAIGQCWMSLSEATSWYHLTIYYWALAAPADFRDDEQEVALSDLADCVLLATAAGSTPSAGLCDLPW